MQSNLTKFQSIFFGNTQPCDVAVGNVNILPTSFIKLLGVTIDGKSKFSTHISNICSKAGRKKGDHYTTCKCKIAIV